MPASSPYRTRTVAKSCASARQVDRRVGVTPREAFEALWALWKHDYPKWVADNIAPFFIPETSPGMVRWGCTLVQVSVPVALACSRDMVEQDFRADLREITLPTLLIHGDRDRSAPIELDCRFLVYEGAPHGIMYTHMDRLHADMLRFVREA